MEPPAPFLIPDCRRPGQAMSAVPLKLPAEAAAQLQAAADGSMAWFELICFVWKVR